MTALDLLEAMGNLPKTFLREEPFRKSRNRIFAVLSAAAVVILIGTVCLRTLVTPPKNFYSPGYPSSPGNAALSPHRGPIASFGLAPLEGAARLNHERVLISCREDRYRARLEASVSLEGPVTFVLPVVMDEGSEAPRLWVDGELIQPLSSRPAFVTVHSPALDPNPQDGNQSIRLDGEQAYAGDQRYSVYQGLLDGYRKDPPTFYPAVDSLLRVYDVSGAPIVDGTASFTVRGRADQLRLVFTNDQTSGGSFAANSDGGRDDEAVLRLNLPKGEPGARFFAVPADSSPLQVLVDGREIPGENVTVSDLFLQKLKADPDGLDDYVDSLSLKWKELTPGTHFTLFNSSLLQSGEGDGMSLFQFTVDAPGEHTIVVESEPLGAQAASGCYAVQWIDSPSDWWTAAGPRTMTLQFDGKEESFPIPDEVINYRAKRNG